MKILVLNCGSSSIKYQLFEMPAKRVLARGAVERIGDDESRAKQSTERGEITIEAAVPDHERGLQIVMDMLTDPDHGAVASTDKIDACGHRVVHGGESCTGSLAIDDALEAVIEEYGDLAPLHNPPNLTGIRAARRVLGNAPQVACFDTAFHQTLPEHAYLYGLPYELYEQYRVRRYGFHGTSHHYVARRAAELLGKEPAAVNLITCHLGNGCSITAVCAGKSVDTSMGLTPLEGVMMGTRSGDFDPAILFYLLGKGQTPAELDKMVNKQSGLLGLSGISNDCRDLEAEAAAGNRRAILALDRYAYSIRKYVGAYLAVLERCDAVVFTGGVGEHRVKMRQRILGGLDRLGIVLDDARNADVVGCEGTISAPDSPTAALVIPTDEEGMIATETYRLVQGE